jgi:hypothetical protein
VRLILKPEVLNNDSKLQEILWNFSRFNPERRLALSQSPHFYHLPTLPNVKWSEFNYRATEENWHTSHTQPIYVLTNTPGRVYLELGRNPWAFDNVWNTNETLIFKSKCLAFRFFSSTLTFFQASVEGSRAKVLSGHPFNTARGATWSTWHQSQSQGWLWFG